MATAPRKVLIVDDNANNRESLRKVFISLGHEVVEAYTGVEALEKAPSLKPDLIMMAARLPELNGDEITAKLKRNRVISQS